jgi:arginase
MNSISLIQVRSELGAGTRGSSLGPSAVMIADIQKRAILADLDMETLPETIQNFNNAEGLEKAKRIDAFTTHINNVCKSVSETCRKGRFPMVLSGDHGNAYGTISGLKKYLGNSKLGVVWIDAHADLNTPFSSPSGNLHGMPLGMAIAEKYGEKEESELGKKWKKLLEIGSGVKKIEAADIAFLAVRETDKGEDHIMQNHNIQNLRVREIREGSVNEAIQRSLKALGHCDHIYISFDVDSMDPGISRGTGTPVENGLSLEEAIEINAGLVTNKKVIAWEMTEVNPLLDEKNVMAESALQVLYSVIDVLNTKN